MARNPTDRTGARAAVAPLADRTPTHVTVTEVRAPTDESVKLLAQLEAAARAKIINAISVGDATFECVVQQRIESESDTAIFTAVFSLNGKRLTAEYSVRSHEIKAGRALPAMVMDGVRDAIALKIAVEVLAPALARLAHVAWKE